MPDMEKAINGLEHLSEWLFQQYRVVYDGDAPNYYDAYKTVDDAIAMLKEQEEEIENLKQTAQSMMEGICLLKEQPEIVRCKDCKYLERLPWLDDETGKAMVCRKHTFTGMRTEDWYCADGERK